MIIYTIQAMISKLTWNETKRQASLADRGLDFSDVNQVFNSATCEFEVMRENYGETRMICYGYLYGRLAVVGYVQRGETRHIYSMRKANEREQSKFG
jgi:uncharacterized DUF497 family protein